MLSKNNNNLWNEKMEPKKQRFAIKKFTVGVASVLIGTTFAFYAGGNSASADTSLTGNVSEEERIDTTKPDQKVTLSTSQTTEGVDTSDQQSAETQSSTDVNKTQTNDTTDSVNKEETTDLSAVTAESNASSTSTESKTNDTNEATAKEENTSEKLVED